jgi:hypothetical protein
VSPGAPGLCRTDGLPILSRGKASLLRFSTQARSSVSPEVRGARRANPASWNDPCVAEPRWSLGTARPRFSGDNARDALRRAFPAAKHP